jgi:hypothetical protein
MPITQGGPTAPRETRAIHIRVVRSLALGDVNSRQPKRIDEFHRFTKFVPSFWLLDVTVGVVSIAIVIYVLRMIVGMVSRLLSCLICIRTSRLLSLEGSDQVM